jgi:hypothetical protein
MASHRARCFSKREAKRENGALQKLQSALGTLPIGDSARCECGKLFCRPSASAALFCRPPSSPTRRTAPKTRVGAGPRWVDEPVRFYFMMKIYIAQMCWCENQVPVCAGTNKKRLVKEALRLLREEYGTGPVWRHGSLCSMPIVANDIDIVEIPILSNVASDLSRHE